MFGSMSFLIEVKKDSEEGDEPRAETESESEEELSCFAPTVCIDSYQIIQPSYIQ